MGLKRSEPAAAEKARVGVGFVVVVVVAPNADRAPHAAPLRAYRAEIRASILATALLLA